MCEGKPTPQPEETRLATNQELIELRLAEMDPDYKVPFAAHETTAILS
jgi:hypothetical protein